MVYRFGAGYVDEICDGAEPVDLPVIQTDRIRLMINLQNGKGTRPDDSGDIACHC